MSRQIRLTKLHALNWYGYCDSLPVSGNLLLAGVSGSGKSVLMDLILIVLLGSERARYGFNRAATGQASGRTLKGYCLGDTKEEESGTPQHMRPNGAITYAALEFTWPGGKRVETWGLRIEFAGAAENSPRHLTSFYCESALGRADFLDDERRPLTLGAFQALIEHHGGRCFRTQDDYRRDMAVTAHLNFDRAVLDRLLPMAMSFTFRSRFNDFCREHILPAEAIDISQVTSSYRAFRQYESELAKLNDQLSRLETIHKLYGKHSTAVCEAAVMQYLEHHYRIHHARGVRDDKAAALERLRVEHAAEREKLEALSQQIAEMEENSKRLGNLIGETPDGKLYLHLRGENQMLARQISDLKARGTTAQEALAARVRNSQAWLDDLRRLDLSLSSSVPAALEKAIRTLEKGGLPQAEDHLDTLIDRAAEAGNELERAAAPLLKRLTEIRRRRNLLREEISRLKSGRLPFPETLRDVLNDKLSWRGADPPARHLRELCEVTDEAWRPALEVAFTRKFAVVVEADDYEEAERVFHSLNAADFGAETGRESLLNPAKALKLPGKVNPGSLASKLRTDHPVAAAVITHLFGDIICVEKLSELRAHSQAILPDGFMSRGAFVERRRFYDGNPFIGANGLQQQLAYKEQQDAELTAAETREAPLERAVKDVQDRFGRTFRPGDSLKSDLAEARQLPEKQKKLDDNIKQLNTLDRQAFEELEQQLAAAELQLRLARDEERELLGSGRTKDVERGERELRKLEGEHSEAEDRFSRLKLSLDISQHLPRYEEARRDFDERWPGKDASAAECARLAAAAGKEEAALWPQVVSEREKLAIEHNRYGDLDAQAKSNAAWEKHRQRIAGADIADYSDKARREQRLWGNLFREHVLEKMRAALKEVENLIILLNNFLKRPIGSSRYRIISWANKDFALQHRMLEASALAKEDELFFASADAGLREAVQQFLPLLTEQPDSKEALRLLDYRNYFEYDMEVHNTAEPGSPPVRVDRKSDLFSGGENQSPYFIAVLA
ncbi:MAG TPA: ATP-binding protein, partial [Verrucomicrobiales bacterium]|nr:ATP-binding protein [Verrucomicrobiales bacterium]